MSKALELADALENLEATGWGGDCFALTEHSEKQAELAAAELRRLDAVEQELEELRRAIREAEPVAFAYLHSDGHYHDASMTEHSRGMHPLYTLKGIK